MGWIRAASISAAIVVAAAALYGGARLQRDRRRRMAVGSVDASACPEALALGGACGACVATECCAAVHACYTDSRCIDLNDCRVRCGDPDEGLKVPRALCPKVCEERYPTAVTLFQAWDNCARGRCQDVCPRGPSDDDEERERGR
jgi:hypothetical protein